MPYSDIGMLAFPNSWLAFSGQMILTKSNWIFGWTQTAIASAPPASVASHVD